jgi:hypothetical protein
MSKSLPARQAGKCQMNVKAKNPNVSNFAFGFDLTFEL